MFHRWILCSIALLSSVALADECSDICTLIPGSCSSKGSYCKNGHACMDLFWYVRDETLCNHENEGCTDRSALLCSEARTIVSARNNSGVRSVSRGSRTTTSPSRGVTRSVTPSEARTTRPVTAAESLRYENSQFNAMTQLLRRSTRFMRAFRQDRTSAYWPGLRRHFESNDITGLVRTIQNAISENPGNFERVSFFEIVLHHVMQRSEAVRNVLDHRAIIECSSCRRPFNANGWANPLVRFPRSGHIQVDRLIVESITLFGHPSCNCPEQSQSTRLVNRPSVIPLHFFETENENARSVQIPRNIDFPNIGRFHLVGLVRKVSENVEQWSVVEDNPDLTLFGVTGVVYESE